MHSSVSRGRKKSMREVPRAMARGQARRKKPVLVAFLAASILLFAGVPAASAQSYPGATNSHYMETVDGATLYNQGCTLGQAATSGSAPSNAIVVLDFGQPWVSGSTYGAKYWYGTGGTFASTSTIANAVEQFGKGFYACSSSTPRLRVASGVNSDSSYVGTSHGAAWGAMVKSINGWFSSNGYTSQVSAAAAIDIESGFSASASMARAWTDGVGQNAGVASYDFGAASGCSWTGYTSPPGYQCNGNWYQDDYWYVSWGAAAAWPLPIVYNQTIITLPNGLPSDPNAQQWEMIRRYGSAYKSGAVVMEGDMTQHTACHQPGHSCSGTDNTQATGWTHLYNSVNAYTPSQGNLPWATDIMWGF